MSLELVSTLASLATFVVIALTAVAAMIQLRHMRSSNQIAILTEFREEVSQPDFRAALHLVRDFCAKLDDPQARAQLSEDPLPLPLGPYLRVAFLFENLGCFVKRGILDANLVCDLWGPVVISTWHIMAPAFVIQRRTRGVALMENFEYLAYVSVQFSENYPTLYPRGTPRVAPEDRWLTEDTVTE
ncbi:MAG: hypothetical protein DLM53_07480 [Candidatus Eremiobacter antarcticus]|nr:hypothetical protein [Candidatus Eremiobacteraeota bacterium]MBC5807217.1 hypothetical protein [Candidatus Eremiobacteraeota bacterium]PZR61900.1 MAG: hypothetical protein DLM53_07480 [Candidatus Eremiobacter sp. RRmetagenome_bin22]